MSKLVRTAKNDQGGVPSSKTMKVARAKPKNDDGQAKTASKKQPVKKLNRKTIPEKKENIVKLVYSKKSKEGIKKSPGETKESQKDVSDEVSQEMEYRETQVVKAFQDIGKRTGRPTRLTEQLTENMEVLARIGLSEESICKAVKLQPSLLARWKTRNPEFSSRLGTAREKGKAVLVNSIFGHGAKNWTAHAWLLERMHRHEFGQNQKLELTGKDSGPLVFKVVYSDKAESTSKKEQS